jgi:hypothetical protein
MALPVKFNCSKIRFAVLILFLLSCTVHAQSGWDQQAHDFVKDAAKNRYKYTIQEVQAAIEKSTVFINTFCKSCSRDVQSSLYLARANLRMYVLDFERENSEVVYRAAPDILSKINADFIKAQSFCDACKCGMIDNIGKFYADYGTQKQLDSLEKEAKAMGKPTDFTYFGINLGYTPEKSIAEIEFGLLNAWTVRQPKKWVNADGSKYRKCSYEYPMAIGLFFVGYERSLVNAKYNAVKIDPIWLNYIVAVHPFQLLYADGPHGKTFIYRPEAGLSFSTFAVDYALNIPFNGAFGFLSRHNLTVRFCIPAIKLH